MALVATACGWLSACVQTNGNTNIVIKNSQINYTAPATGDLVAICQAVSTSQLQKCQMMLQRFGKGTLTIYCQLFSNQKAVADWQGEFVIYADEKKLLA